jgi:hypothetical protein
MMIDSLQKLRPPATALIIAGSLNGMIGLLALLGGLIRLAGVGGRETLPMEDAERIGYIVSTIVGYATSLLSLLVAPVVIYGAIQMMRAKKISVARLAAILAIIPFTSCCFLVGIPVGIWALITLSKPDVKAAFYGDAAAGNFYPPQPPQNW